MRYRSQVQTLRFMILLLIGGTLGGCHLVKRTKECAALQQIFEDAAPELKTQRIGDNPEAQVLLGQAKIYEQLAVEVQGHHFSDLQLQKESTSAQNLLNKLATDLKAAATTIEVTIAAKQPRTLRMETAGQGRSNSHSPITLQQRRYQQLKKSIDSTSAALHQSMQNLSSLCH